MLDGAWRVVARCGSPGFQAFHNGIGLRGMMYSCLYAKRRTCMNNCTFRHILRCPGLQSKTGSGPTSADRIVRRDRCSGVVAVLNNEWLARPVMSMTGW